jgi:hypothetical protein
MPTPANIVTEICEDAGVNDASGSDDRVKAMKCLNRAVEEVQTTALCAKGVYAVSPAGDVDCSLTNWSAFPGEANLISDDNLIAIDHVMLGDGVADGNYIPTGGVLDQYSLREILAMRANNASGVAPTAYAYSPGTIHLDSSASDTQLLIFATVSTAALTETSTEDDILGIPVAWHNRLLLPLATAILLEGWEAEEARAVVYRRRADTAMAAFLYAQNRARGVNQNRYPIQDFNTPGVMER